MKKFNLSALLALAMALCMAFAGTAMAESADAADTEFDPEALINSLTGSYTELFTTICAPEYDEVWLEKCKAVVGEENAEMVAGTRLRRTLPIPIPRASTATSRAA